MTADQRRADFLASGLRTISVRRAARAEAAEIAQLCGADITRTGRRMAAHGKSLLSRMLVEMGVDDLRAGSLKKDELVAFVGASAAREAWAPASLSFRLSPDVPAAPEDGVAAPQDLADETIAA